MTEIEDATIALVVTSPPYNVGQEYEDNLSLKEYLYFLSDVFEKIRSKLIIGGRLCINIANTGRNPYVPLSSHITNILLQLGYVPEGEVIWVKPTAYGASNTSFGSWRLPSNPTLSDRHEYILIFRKDERKRDISQISEDVKEASRLSKDDFLKFRSSIWELNTARNKNHPCVFPISIPSRLISFYSFIGDSILDPFMGSGTTAVAAKLLNRDYVGFELQSHYFTEIQKNLR